MFAANTKLDIGPRFAPAPDADFHQFTHAKPVDGHKRVHLKDAAGGIGAKETRRIVPAQTIGRLRQIIGAEAEKLSLPGIAWARRQARGNSIMVPI